MSGRSDIEVTPQSDLLTLKDGQLDFDLLPQQPPPTPQKPFTPQTPSTPLMIRQSSTSFSSLQRSLIAKEAQMLNMKPKNSIIIEDKAKNSHKVENIEVMTKADGKTEIASQTQNGIQLGKNTNHCSSTEKDSDDDNQEENSYSEYSSFSDDHDDEEEETRISDEEMLSDKGYQVQRKICDTSQGCMYEAMISDPSAEIQRVAIKKTEKILYSKRISIQNDMNIVTNENIIKEAIILHHLTIDNKATADYIVKFIDFFETDSGYFLVMEYGGDITLDKFCDQAFEYINNNKLDYKEYKRIVKYIFWQLSVVCYWMNNDMNCCHLDLHMENLMVQNATFIQGKDGKITINPSIHIKVIDFGLSEVFKCEQHGVNEEKLDQDEKENDDDNSTKELDLTEELQVYEYDPYEIDWENADENPFFCRKFGINNNHQYCAPKLWVEEPYDARKSDAWGMGIILFRLATGCNPYINADCKKDSGYWCIKHNNLRQYLEMNDLSKYVSNTLLQLLSGLLNMDESERYLTWDIIHHQWYRSYYAKYKERIESKSISQIQRHKNQKQKMKIFPFYDFQLIKHPSQQ